MSDDADAADDFVNPFGRTRATHTLCAGCQRVLPSALFRAKSSLGQAVARGFKSPYEITSKYCKDCRDKKAAEKRKKATRGGAHITSNAARRKLLQRVAWAASGRTNEHAYVLQGKLAEGDGFIRGQRRDAQYKRWRDERARAYAPAIEEIDKELNRLHSVIYTRAPKDLQQQTHYRSNELPTTKKNHGRGHQEVPLTPDALKHIYTYQYILRTTRRIIREVISGERVLTDANAKNPARWQDIFKLVVATESTPDFLLMQEFSAWYTQGEATEVAGYRMFRKGLRWFE